MLAGVVQALITAVRSLIFTGIANRVDMDTRETILDRLVRLPQGFFDARPVGQITYYFNQLDRLRDFLISKALTTLVDFSFSLLYLAVLLSLNPLLTLITLSHPAAVHHSGLDRQSNRGTSDRSGGEEGRQHKQLSHRGDHRNPDDQIPERRTENPLGLPGPLQPLHRRRFQTQGER